MIYVLMHHTTNWHELTAITKPIMQEYCDDYGYELNIKEVPAYSVYTGIEKLKQIVDLLKEGDIALVMDADACITNLTIPIESFLEDGKDLYLSEGLNMGVFLVRSTPMNISIIELMISEIESGIFNCEQDAIQFHRKHIPNLCIKKHPCFNSYLSELYPEIPQPVTEQQGQWVEGSYILHLPALSLEKRVEIMKNIKITR